VNKDFHSKRAHFFAHSVYLFAIFPQKRSSPVTYPTQKRVRGIPNGEKLKTTWSYILSLVLTHYQPVTDRHIERVLRSYAVSHRKIPRDTYKVSSVVL